MSKSKLYAWILSILGVQLQSCFPFSAIEYGCPHTEFKATGSVKNENGEKLQNAEIDVKIEVFDPNGNKSLETQKKVTSDKDGNYEVRYGECDFTYPLEKIKYEVISYAPRYKYDTIRKEVEKQDIRIIKKGDEDKIINQEINVVLKKRIKNENN